MEWHKICEYLNFLCCFVHRFSSWSNLNLHVLCVSLPSYSWGQNYLLMKSDTLDELLLAFHSVMKVITHEMGAQVTSEIDVHLVDQNSFRWSLTF